MKTCYKIISFAFLSTSASAFAFDLNDKVDLSVSGGYSLIGNSSFSGYNTSFMGLYTYYEKDNLSFNTGASINYLKAYHSSKNILGEEKYEYTRGAYFVHAGVKYKFLNNLSANAKLNFGRTFINKIENKADSAVVNLLNLNVSDDNENTFIYGLTVGGVYHFTEKFGVGPSITLNDTTNLKSQGETSFNIVAQYSL